MQMRLINIEIISWKLIICSLFEKFNLYCDTQTTFFRPRMKSVQIPISVYRRFVTNIEYNEYGERRGSNGK